MNSRGRSLHLEGTLQNVQPDLPEQWLLPWADWRWAALLWREFPLQLVLLSVLDCWFLPTAPPPGWNHRPRHFFTLEPQWVRSLFFCSKHSVDTIWLLVSIIYAVIYHYIIVLLHHYMVTGSYSLLFYLWTLFSFFISWEWIQMSFLSSVTSLTPRLFHREEGYTGWGGGGGK